MPTLTLTEVLGEPREWSPKDHPERVFHSYRVKAADGTVYEINRKPESGPPKLGADEYEITPAKGDFPPKLKRVAQNAAGGFSGGGGAKDAYWEAKDKRDIEGIARMGRAHAQEMALKWWGLCGLPEEGAVRNVAELLPVIDWFQQDVDSVVDAGLSGGSSGSAESPARPTPSSAAAESSISDKQLQFMERLLQEAGVDVQDRLDIKAWAKEKLTGGKEGSASKAIDAIKSGDEGISRLLTAAKEWVANQPTIPGDERDLQPPPDAVVGSAEDIPF